MHHRNTLKPGSSHPGASLWGPLKELWETVDGAVLRRQPESVHLLDLQLKKHKPHFLSLYKNPVRFCANDTTSIIPIISGCECEITCVIYNFLGTFLVTVNMNNLCHFIIFSQRVQSRERRCVKPAQRASPSRVSRDLGSFQSSF